MRLRRKSDKTAVPRSAASMRVLENFIPPEGVPIGFELASLGARFGAVILDLILTWLFILLLILAVAWLGILPKTALFALVVILAFFVGVPYYVVSELIWNGRTLGKRIVGIKVISADSRALGAHQIVARNLLKDVEFFAPLGMVLQWNYTSTAQSRIAAAILLVWTVFAAIYPIRNKRKQRLGDVVAGTLVIVKPKAILLDDLALTEAQGGFVFDQAQLDIYGSYELQTLEAILRDTSKSQLHAAELAKVAKAIARRINYSEHAIGADPRPFLMAFYRDQRERLESRLLFGERRQDKFHGDAPKPK